MKKIVFVCQACGTKFPKWVGRCTGCGEWETVVEEAAERADRRRPSPGTGAAPLPLSEIAREAQPRHKTSLPEFDHVLGGGIVPGSLVLVGGDPGIGKSTLLLQVSDALARQGRTVLYVSGEESPAQIKIRAERLGCNGKGILLFAENDLSVIQAHLEKIKPDLAVIDSIQTVFSPEFPSAQGSVGQVRECASLVMRLAKSMGMPVFLIGHVTRDGTIAGPRVLEHIVDTVLYFEGDRNNLHRVLRVIKNRFGPTNEIAVFEMKQAGLAEVMNPSEIFLSERNPKAPGSVIACAAEGTRPLLIEVQALVSKMNFNYPQRTAAGIDGKRLSLICAVLERVADYPLSTHDIFLSIAGGLRVDEPALDLAVACAVVSSLLNRPLDPKTCVAGEVGLSGEVRSVGLLEQRLREARKLGFTRAVVPAGNAKNVSGGAALVVTGVRTLREALEELFH